jgi:hypothetical protein
VSGSIGCPCSTRYKDIEEIFICSGDAGLLFIRVSQDTFRVLFGPWIHRGTITKFDWGSNPQIVPQ